MSRHFAVQQAQLDAGRTTHAVQVAAATAEHRARVAGTSMAGRQRIGAVAAQASAEAGGRVSEMAAEVDHHAAGQAARTVADAPGHAAAARPAIATSDPEVAGQQRKVADAVSGKARTEVAAAADRTAAKVREHGARMRTEVFGPTADQARQQIGELARESDRAVGDGASVASGEIAGLGAQATRAAADAYRRATAALTAGRETARGDLTTWATRAKDRVTTIAGRLRTSVENQGRALAATRRRPHPATLDALRTAGGQVADAIGETGRTLRDGLEQLADSHGAAGADVGDRVRQGFTAAATAATTAAGRAEQAFDRHAGQIGAEAAADLTAAPDRTAAALSPHRQKGLADLSGAVDEAGTEQRSWASDARGRGEDGADRIASEARNLATTAPAQRIFDEAIASMRSWLRDKLGDIAGGIASGLVLSLPTLLVAGALLLAGPVGWGVLAALIVVGAGLGIYSRFSEYAADHGGQGPGWGEGTLLVLLGVADITGIPYLVEAGVGRRAFAPRPMTEFERWERGTQGVVNLALVVVGGGKKVFGAGERISVPADPHPPATGGGGAHPVVDPHGPAPDPHGPTPDPNAGPARPRDCFVPGTPVATPSGPVTIERLAVDDLVLTLDPATGRPGAHPVAATLRRTVPAVLEVSLGTASVSVSPEHPFRVADGSWRRAGDLEPGTRLVGLTGEVVVGEVRQRPGDAHEVVNLTVAGAHTYLVSDAQVLVHNKGAAFDPVADLRTQVESLVSRVRQARKAAEAQPADTPGRTDRLNRLRQLEKATDQLQKESNGPDPDVADLGAWADQLDNDLHPIEQDLPPAPEPGEHLASQPLTDAGAFEALQQRRLWTQITEADPGRRWSARLAENMTSDVAGQTKHKLLVTGRKAGAPPVEIEVSVIYDRTTGRFEDMHLSSGASSRQ
ncbi:Hint domain-containing protein [Amycolatopsis sp. CA-128772]|uniref:Hint domain-containing protein n=1 Tax=Amycolatopsis sp. CA-128772 TaxID=2073159 RepID=UPI0011B00E44|nr:Hint domain-containing protein [Amycolatopsis sp. CA-128772]